MESAYYARYYLGQRFWFKTESGFEAVDAIVSVSDNGNDVHGFNDDLWFWYEKDKITDFKMILKRTCDMPRDIQAEYKKLCKRIRTKSRNVFHVADTPFSLAYAIEMGYDMFDLIDGGLAFDEMNLPDSIKKLIKTTNPS